MVEVALNFTPLIADAGGSGALDPASLRVQEIDGGGDGQRVQMRILPRTAATPGSGRPGPDQLMLTAAGLAKRYKSRQVVRDFGLS